MKKERNGDKERKEKKKKERRKKERKRKLKIYTFNKSTNGSFVRYFLDLHKEACSMMWQTPVESRGTVRNAMLNVLLSSSVAILTTCPPLLMCSYSVMSSLYSSTVAFLI